LPSRSIAARSNVERPYSIAYTRQVGSGADFEQPDRTRAASAKPAAAIHLLSILEDLRIVALRGIISSCCDRLDSTVPTIATPSH
jgi:hypothetical protein